VRLVYVDEAGTGKIEQEPFVVVAGVIVHGDRQLNELIRRLEKVRSKHLPEEHRGDYVLHAKELFNGGGKLFGRNNPEWPIERRMMLAADIAAIPKELRLWISLGWVDRTTWPTTFSWPRDASENERILGALATSFLGCSAQLDQWMRKHAKNENCMIIAEDNPVARSLIVKTQNANQSKKFVDSLDEKAKKFFPFRHIKEDPAFQPKKPAHPLELADFCAYVWKRYLMYDADVRYLPYFEPWRKQIAIF
jgi:hypothetical protein